MQTIHNEKASRFEIHKDGLTAVLEYRLEGNVITFHHTGVPSALEGQGIGSALAKSALNFARENNYKVIATCWFVAGYIERHPEYKTLV